MFSAPALAGEVAAARSDSVRAAEGGKEKCMTKRKINKESDIVSQMSEKLEVRAREITDGMIKTDAMEAQASYLRRGRRFENLSIDKLQQLWAQAFRDMVNVRNNNNSQALNDTSSELAIRGVEPDATQVQSEMAQLIEEIKRTQLENPDGDRAIRDAIRDYMRRIDDEMN